MVLIFVIVLVLFGGQKLPEFARGLGKSIREFKKAAGILGGLWEKVRERPQEFLDAGILEREGLDTAAKDFVAGMTDRFAVALYESLVIPRPWVGPMAWNQL